jgi:pimeloyl-ACP methyl ester carboxylesterase
VRRINNQGVELAFTDSGAGTPTLLIHGYPDSSVLWRHQIDPLTAAGLQVIAPDLRGFGESGKPDAVSDYAVGHAVGDMVAILDALDIERSHVVGHDWGAALAWGLAILAPQRVDRLVALSVGHPQAWSAKTIEDRRLSWYMLLLQFEEAQDLLRRDDYALAREWLATHPDRDDVLETLVSTPAINWYRANVHPRADLDPPRGLPPVQAPTLGIWSDGDAFVSERQMIESPLDRYERLEGAGHWMQLDAPERVTELILEHLC